MPALQQRIGASGIGLAGIDGCWWLPAAQPFALPVALADELAAFGAACFALFDAVGALRRTPAGRESGLDALLEHKVPPDLLEQNAPAPVLALRPDFQLCPLDGPARYRLAATELEICPSAQGYAHAMQRGYGLAPDLAEAYAHLLAGRELLIVATAQWSEFLWDQLAFCRALAEHGARARVLLDIPIAELINRVRSGAAWQPPMFGVPTRPPDWDDDIPARLQRHNLAQFLDPSAGWPADVGDALVFRFGYLECFSPAQWARMREWQARGAQFVNPPSFYLDSKVVMAALGLPALRQQIEASAPGALAALDRGIPETRLLLPETVAQLRAEQNGWVIKYAGFDRGEQAWGGRSLAIGAQHTPAQWAELLRASLALPWPVVAQRSAPSARIDIQYEGANGQAETFHGTTRLRSFLLREAGEGAVVAGTHLTVAGEAVRVAEGTDTVQGPIVFVEGKNG